MAVNQYKKDGNGPNAHKKGNRTKTGRNPAPAIEINKQIGEDIARYKEIAESVRKSRKWKQEDLSGVYEKIKKYIDATDDEEPLTVSGMMFHSGMNKDCWYSAVNGEYDYRLYEYIETHNIDINTASIDDEGIPYVINAENEIVMLICWSDVLQKALLYKEHMDERRLLKKGRVADIFNMKAIHGWQEEQAPHTVNNTLIIGESDARKAIDALEKARLP